MLNWNFVVFNLTYLFKSVVFFLVKICVIIAKIGQKFPYKEKVIRNEAVVLHENF